MRVPGRRSPSEKLGDMVESQIRRRGIVDPRVLDAMRSVPRDRFVPAKLRHAAFRDGALPIGHGATISQPYIVALMTSALEIDRDGLRVLEVGTGSGYQAAVLAECGCEVFSIERVEALYDRTRALLSDLGYADRVHVRLGDGSRGWPEAAPFDRVIVTAAAAAVPSALREQLAPNGSIIAPVGDERGQVIRRYRLEDGRWTASDLEGARFVPLIEDARPETR
ncbi:MAG: protein-L-isoaspartate(D-aspartate) O-methyltransferase [marine benthic group bacterium]|nr:protein-L-isoaspartate(D-aspartate) O-methyltransferase [Gemmatimonadota bacterium]MCL7956871.1 protein-L-isoaspartate(D-aspartate) O-methyltransferase [Gemmatimonadota bacterium]MCL7969052.1 protein-L-isoaspartate(D-aspartate) O-methyltransferase [Gemmatimonadota bacterium]MCL7973206.1 protein-L-isoaspartate(D-aspartate) O-methyltransferase [Gemmatimonadota bacterium]MCL7983448.1 protein-L-isoaspartate(D-aspartate) O-methyltransferase [Gemmatimonadota bacterium]